MLQEDSGGGFGCGRGGVRLRVAKCVVRGLLTLAPAIYFCTGFALLVAVIGNPTVRDGPMSRVNWRNLKQVLNVLLRPVSCCGEIRCAMAVHRIDRGQNCQG